MDQDDAIENPKEKTREKRTKKKGSNIPIWIEELTPSEDGTLTEILRTGELLLLPLKAPVKDTWPNPNANKSKMIESPCTPHNHSLLATTDRSCNVG